MTAYTVYTLDPEATDPMFGAPVDPAFEPASDNASIMAGSDMYRRMQARPKKSPTGYLVGGVAVVAIIAGGVYFAGHQNHAVARHAAQMAAVSAISSDQQAQASNAQAQASQRSAVAAADLAQADAVAKTGNPPAETTQTQPTTTRVTTGHRAAEVRHAPIRQAAPSATDAAAGVDASAITAPPASVTVNQPAPSTPASAAVVPAPPTPAAIPAPTAATPTQPAPATPDQTQAQPQTAPPPQ